MLHWSHQSYDKVQLSNGFTYPARNYLLLLARAHATDRESSCLDDFFAVLFLFDTILERCTAISSAILSNLVHTARQVKRTIICFYYLLPFAALCFRTACGSIVALIGAHVSINRAHLATWLADRVRWLHRSLSRIWVHIGFIREDFSCCT